MRKIHELNDQQKQFAALHHDIVENFLRRNLLDADEFYDVVIFGYLLAVQEYLEKPELAEYAFSTIAWRNMKDCLAKEYLYRTRDKRTATVTLFEDETMSLDMFLPRRRTCLDEALGNQELLVKLLSCMTPKEKEVVHLKADGYTYREIAEICSITIYGVGSRFSRMRRRIRNMALL